MVARGVTRWQSLVKQHRGDMKAASRAYRSSSVDASSVDALTEQFWKMTLLPINVAEVLRHLDQNHTVMIYSNHWQGWPAIPKYTIKKEYGQYKVFTPSKAKKGQDHMAALHAFTPDKTRTMNQKQVVALLEELEETTGLWHYAATY